MILYIFFKENSVELFKNSLLIIILSVLINMIIFFNTPKIQPTSYNLI